MSAAFGYPELALTASVVDLIGRGELKARIDAASGTLVARRTEPRIEAFKNALEQGEKVQKRAKGAQLRCVVVIFSFPPYLPPSFSPFPASFPPPLPALLNRPSRPPSLLPLLVHLFDLATNSRSASPLTKTG